MIGDIGTVVWKEWREFRDSLLSFRRGGLSALILAIILGVVTPIQMAEEWITSPLMIVYWVFIATSMVSSLIADSVAGERERHTLETLLASRLPDSAILIGKMIAAVMYGVGFAVVNLAVGWVSVNAAHSDGTLLLFTRERLFLILGFTALGSAFVAGVGVFISLRATTVKQAQQTFGIAMVLLILVPVLTFQAISYQSRFRLLTQLTQIGTTRIVLGISGVLFVLTVLVLAGALARFRRGRLVLD